MTRLFDKSDPRLRRRHAAETRFRWFGQIAILVALGFLLVMVTTIAWDARGAFTRAKIGLSVDLSTSGITEDQVATFRFDTHVKDALRARFPDVTKRKEKRLLYGLLSADAPFELRRAIADDPALLKRPGLVWFVASDDVGLYMKGEVDASRDQDLRRIGDQQIAWIEQLRSEGHIRLEFNSAFFTSGDSREPELAGILSALVGSGLSLAVCFALSFPIGIMAAIYLEEFAPKSWISDVIEININNLAAVPSIIFGLLGLAIFLNFFGLPRSSPLVGGMVLSLMTLPTIIIASRASLRSVPPSIREAALALGASPVQATFHHVAPLALPGMFTGAIVGMARALGDTAPLLMIGMVAFIVDVPTSLLDPATALPVQIFLWADSPERAFLAKTSAAIIVLLAFLVAMNLAAILLRRKFEIRF